ncbi:MAG: TauD/TfdA family dioxygenase, partial [Gemmatimonadota bacterium]|nr:TauD/TfdA family dioxygenase [Gemmatimonadota bacterium]
MGIRIESLNAALGARVTGLEVARLDDTARKRLRDAFFEYQVLFFPELDPTPTEHELLASVFGEPEEHVEGREEDRRTAHYADDKNLILIIDSGRNAANYWHTDATFRETPPSTSMIVTRSVPSKGGDTMWLDTYQAFAALPLAVQELARKLQAVHGHPGITVLNSHPVV